MVQAIKTNAQWEDTLFADVDHTMQVMPLDRSQALLDVLPAHTGFDVCG